MEEASLEESSIVSITSDATKVKQFNTKTDRKLLLKLELTGDVKHQLETVQHKIFDLDFEGKLLSRPAENSLYWRTTDDVLYSQAKKAYDQICKAFTGEPQVYKLESTKEKVWKNSLAERKKADDYEATLTTEYVPLHRSTQVQPGGRGFKSLLRKKKHNQEEEQLTPRTAATHTYINPFTEGDHEEIWTEKLQMLSKLTPREDLDGYEYREDYDEQQYRLSLQKDYQERLQQEIQRRLEQPTVIEQVEDVLFDMITYIDSENTEKQLFHKVLKREKTRKAQHPCIGYYQMKPLPIKEGEDGQIVQALTDETFVEMIVAPGGFVYATNIPNRVFIRHAEEKRLLQALLKRQRDEKELIRKLPLSEKLWYDINLGTGQITDLPTVIRQIMSDIVDSTVILPSRPYRETTHHVVNKILKNLQYMKLHPEETYYELQDNLVDKFHQFLQWSKKKRKGLQKKDIQRQKLFAKVELSQLLNEMKQLNTLHNEDDDDNDNEHERTITSQDIQLQLESGSRVGSPIRALRAKSSKQNPLSLKRLQFVQEETQTTTNTKQDEIKPITSTGSPYHLAIGSLDEHGTTPVQLPDAIMMKVMLHVDCPPAYVIRPRKTFRQEIHKLSSRAQELIQVQKATAIDTWDQYKHRKEIGYNPYQGKEDGSHVLSKEILLMQSIPASQREELAERNRLPIRNIVGSKHYTGEIKPEDLIITFSNYQKRTMHVLTNEKDITDKQNNVVYDNTERKQFENQLLEELSYAACIPLQNIQIEQIHRLEADSSKLKEKIVLKTTKLQLYHQKQKENDLKIMMERVRRKALTMGIWLTDREVTASLIKQQKLAPQAIEHFPLLDTISSNDSMTTNSMFDLSTLDSNEVNSNVMIEFVSQTEEEKDHKLIETVVNEMITLLEREHELTILVQLFPNVAKQVNIHTVQDLMIVEKKVPHSSNNTHHTQTKTDLVLGIQEEEEEDELIDEESKMSRLSNEIHSTFSFPPMKTAPIPPTTAKFGLANPADMKNDSTYWFAKQLKALDDDEKATYRIRLLPKLRDYYTVLKTNQNTWLKWQTRYKTIDKEFKLSKEEYHEDFLDFIEPIIERLEPYLNEMKPYYYQFQKVLVEQLQFLIAEINILLSPMNFQDVKSMKHFVHTMHLIQSHMNQHLSTKGPQTKASNGLSTKVGNTNNILAIVDDQAHPIEIKQLVDELCIEIEKRITWDELNESIGEEQSLEDSMDEEDDDREVGKGNEDEDEEEEDDLRDLAKGDDDADDGSLVSYNNNNDKKLKKNKVDESEDEDKDKDEDEEEDDDEDDDDKKEKEDDDSKETNKDDDKKDDKEDDENEEEEVEEVEEEVEEGEDGEEENEEDAEEEEEEDVEEEGEGEELEENSKENDTGLVEGSVEDTIVSGEGEPPPIMSKQNSKTSVTNTSARPSSGNNISSRSNRPPTHQSCSKEEEQLFALFQQDAKFRYDYILGDPMNYWKTQQSKYLEVQFKQQQARIIAATTIATESNVVLLDEPTKEVSLLEETVSKPVVSKSLQEMNSQDMKDPKVWLDKFFQANNNTNTMKEDQFPVLINKSSEELDQLIWQEYDQLYWQRLQTPFLSSSVYEKDIVDTMQTLCDVVVDRVEDELALEQKVYGCEVTFTILIRPEQREIVPGLSNLCAQDIAKYIQQQVYNPYSVLNQGNITQKIVDLSILPNYERIPSFDSWDNYWIHSIHPVFFRYSAKQKDQLLLQYHRHLQTNNSEFFEYKKHTTMTTIHDDVVIVTNSKQDKTTTFDGLTIINPAKQFDERTKEAYIALLRKPRILGEHEHIKRIIPGMKPPPDPMATATTGIIDFNIDEHGKEIASQGLQLYRPNMEKVTPKDLQRLKRIFREAKFRYEHEMQCGLIRNGLRFTQFQSLKLLQGAERLFRVAKQRYEHNQRKLLSRDELPYAIPDMQVTAIEDSVYDGWVTEAKEEDALRLKEKRTKKAQMKLQLQLEAKIRQQMVKWKYWLLEHYFHYYELQCKLQKEQNEALNESSSSQVAGDDNNKNDNDSVSLYFASSLLTNDYIKQLYDLYYTYIHDNYEITTGLQKQMKQIEELDHLYALLSSGTAINPALINPETKKQLDQYEEKKLQEKKRIISEEKNTRRLFPILYEWCKQCIEQQSKVVSEVMIVGESMPSDIIQGTDEIIPIDQQPVVTVIAITNPSNEVKLNEEEHGQTQAFSHLTLSKSKTLEFLEVVFTLLQQQEDFNRKYNPHLFDKTSDKRTGTGTATTAAASKPGTQQSRMIASANANKKTVEVFHGYESSFTVAEWEVINSVEWIQVLYQHPPLLDCWNNFPTSTSTDVLRDELVSFAALLVSLVPIFNAVLIPLNKEKGASGKNAIMNSDSKSTSASSPGKKQKKKPDGREERRQQKILQEEQDILAAQEQIRKQKEDEAKEEEVRLQEVQKLAELQKVWFMSHTHKYIRPKENETKNKVNSKESNLLFGVNAMGIYTMPTPPIRKPGQKTIPLISPSHINFLPPKQYFATQKPFCIVCKQRQFEFYSKTYYEEEEEHARSFASLQESYLIDHYDDGYAYIEEMKKPMLLEKVKLLVRKELQSEGILDNDGNPVIKTASKGNLLSTLTHQVTADQAKEAYQIKDTSSISPSSKKASGSLHAEDSIFTTESTKLIASSSKRLSPDEQYYEDWKNELKEIKKLCKQANLPAVDCKGHSIFPEKPPKKPLKNKKSLAEDGTTGGEGGGNNNKEVKDIPKIVITDYRPKQCYTGTEKMRVNANTIEGGDNESNNEEGSELIGKGIGIGYESIHECDSGIKIRIFHRDESHGYRQIFLGMIVITGKELMKPPKGFRTYKLQSDPTILEEEPVPVITGTLAVQLNLTTSYKPMAYDASDPTIANIPEDERPMMKRYHWKLTLRKLSNVVTIHETNQSNPYCEIYWQGMIENKYSPLHPILYEGKKHKPYLYLPYYEFIGQSKTIYHVNEYEFNQEEAHDGSYYEFPPIYSPKILPNRYNMLENSVQYYGGGYIAKQLTPEMHTFHQEELQKLQELYTKQQEELSNASIQIENIMKRQTFREKQMIDIMISDEIVLYLKYCQLIEQIEEQERHIMGQEDYKMHYINLQQILVDYEEEILLQDYYLQEYSKLIDQVIAPSSLLTRLKFIMGEEMNERERKERLNILYQRKGNKVIMQQQTKKKDILEDDEDGSEGGFVKPSMLADIYAQSSQITEQSSLHSSLPERLTLASLHDNKGAVKHANPPSTILKVRCEDPSSKEELFVQTVPIQSYAQEEYFHSQLYSLIGKHSYALIKVFECSVHDITTYNAQGFATMTQRTGVIMLEYFESIEVLQYVQYLATMQLLTNELFREILLLCIAGLVELHAEDMIHRNVTPFAYHVQTPDMGWKPPVITAISGQGKASLQKTMNSLHRTTQKRANASVMVKLGDYWFLENPHPLLSGDQHNASNGLADWGSRMTAPPEVLQQGGSKQNDAITAKSDIFAFGVCVFYWATNGMQLPPDKAYLRKIDSLQSYLPGYWGPWVLNLLRMCLSADPKCRASAKEIQMYLQNRMNR